MQYEVNTVLLCYLHIKQILISREQSKTTVEPQIPINLKIHPRHVFFQPIFSFRVPVKYYT